MKNITKKQLYIGLIVSVALLLLIISIVMLNKRSSKPAELDLTAVSTKLDTKNYDDDFVRLKETGDIYYKAPDGSRYLFVHQDVFNSWFTVVPEIPEQTIAQMEQSPLGGQISVRPGTLITTDTDPNTYIALGGKSIKKITPQQIQQYFWQNPELTKVDLANYYFTAYTVLGDFEVGDIEIIINNQLPERCLITR